MLKRLELIGFKSFADKTRFEFAAGITAIVGPNGSGKSNIVDAVKWVLGEQSAKSLRGGEMADVIFNGSSTRKSLGLAEVTMTFDNAKRLLPLDSEEVQITRRVYRDGQGEYLINNQLSRLKDIKELFLGSGAGHGAYSVIEQGRVDALLTSSPKDRRIIFEEAAGISRFRAKKIETLRKLERVETDLQRVRDILLELEKQLRTLRLQAAKAQRYQEYTTRLKELRVGLSLEEYRELIATLTQEETKLATLQSDAMNASTQIAEAEQRLRDTEKQIAIADRQQRAHETRAAEARQQIATLDASIKFERGQAENLEAELLHIGSQRVELNLRMRNVGQAIQAADAEVNAVAERAQGEQERADATSASLSAVTSRIAELTRQTQHDRDAQFQLVGRVARLQGDTETLRTETERLRKELVRKLAEAERARRQRDALETLLDDLSRSDADLQQKLSGAKHNHNEHVHYREELRKKAELLQLELESQRESRSASRGRADVLENLERTWEGIGSGVREVLKRIADGDEVLSKNIAGLVADLLTTSHENAPLIDLALGESAQRFVVSNPEQLDHVLMALGELSGRVGLIPLAPLALPERNINDGLPILNADSFVSVERLDLAELPRRLLGNVLIVDSLTTARGLHQSIAGYRFLTRAGELLEADGTLTVGPALSGTGILSRRSELRELRQQIAALDTRIVQQESQQAAYRRQADSLETPIRALETEMAALSGEAGTLRDQIREQRQVQQQFSGMLELLRVEIGQWEAEVARSQHAWETTQKQAQEAEIEERALKEKLTQANAEMLTLHTDRELRQAENITAQVALSRVNEQLAGLRKRREDLAYELKQRKIDGVNLTSTERNARARLLASTLAMLNASGDSALAYLAKEQNEAALALSGKSRELLRTQRDEVQAELKQIRDAGAEHKDRAHAHELLVRDLTNRRDMLLSRMQEDYALDLATLLDHPAPEAEHDASSVNEHEDAQAEIDGLKHKIAKLGSVNLEALDELADVEKRESDLRAQHDDLTDGQRKLQAIIEQINTDSRRLFTDLMNVVRGHFLELFRKLFGGGIADIVLENEVDPLESGIEVTARPPGKELRSISLLSGGERTLTAIALLLAIFRSRPSPFCLLDEVDAALDEANTARLAGAIREFLDRSQFIIITHKKRTMATADVLYGITMQESGISKQVAMRFEDWPDEASSTTGA